MKLREKTEKVFQRVRALTDRHPALEALGEVLRECHERFDQPMRVAVVGLIKAGKSTAMNALLGEAVVATGTVETTFNVNWLKWGEQPSLLVHYKDNRPPERKPFAELETLTGRAKENFKSLLSIKHIEVFYPSAILKTFDLVDTPGLASFYEADSQNTKDFLGLHGEEISRITREEAAQADAVLYLFSQSIHAEDKSIVEQFLGGAGNPTPINAIGVLTKTDFYYPSNRNPLEAGASVAERLRGDSKVRRLFYTVHPISGLLGFGAQTLAPEEFETLKKLAALPAERLDKLLGNAERFTAREYPDVPAAPAERELVFKRLGLYGVFLACGLIRKGADNRELLTSGLFQSSGVPQLRDLIVSHFGNRAFLIKLGTGLQQIKNACFIERRRAAGKKESEAIEEIAGIFDDFETNEHAFRELRVLRVFYEGKLEFSSSEGRQLLEVTGEYGISLGERLGLGENAAVKEILRVAQDRMNYWHCKANGFRLFNRETIDAMHVLARSYERIFHHAKQVKHYLNT